MIIEDIFTADRLAYPDEYQAELEVYINILRQRHLTAKRWPVEVIFNKRKFIFHNRKEIKISITLLSKSLKKKRKNKFGNKIVYWTGQFHGETISAIFGSRKEFKRFEVLYILEKKGEIKDLKLHPGFIIKPKTKWSDNIKYTADFSYFCLLTNKKVIQDVKSKPTRKKTDYVMRKKMLLDLIKDTAVFIDDV